jgi:SAM-dependent methyltransferase
MTEPTGRAGYALGHSQRELERLSGQAEIFAPFTFRMLKEAGLSEGMRVLDVGCGNGDVSFLAASLAGASGEVVGVDKAPAAVEKSRERARNAAIQNVTFEAGDALEMPFGSPFDAIIGRLVLMHQPDPVAMLRRLASLLRPGGIIAFQEFDIRGAHSCPPSPIFEQCLRWVLTAFERTGTDSRMGQKLYATFMAAGLPAPRMSFDAGIWGGPENPATHMLSEVVRSLLPVLQKFNIATEAEVAIDSLQERMQRELLEGGAIAISPSLIGAWTNLE